MTAWLSIRQLFCMESCCRMIFRRCLLIVLNLAEKRHVQPLINDKLSHICVIKFPVLVYEIIFENFEITDLQISASVAQFIRQYVRSLRQFRTSEKS